MHDVVSSDGTHIAFERLGPTNGEPLILVGGALCDRRARSAGLPLAKELEASFHVYCYDRRGRGDSGPGASPYAIEREIEDLAALLAEAGGRACVYGHSSGAVLAVRAAAAGLSFSRLVLYEAPLVQAPDRLPLSADLGAKLARLVNAGRRGEAVEAFFTWAVALDSDRIARVKTSPAWPALEALAHTLPYEIELTRDVEEVLRCGARTLCPALVLDGERSASWMRDAQVLLSQSLPAAECRTLIGQAHDVQPNVVAAAIREFILGARS